ncbi:MAG: hypothetical protein KDE27_12425 [Planctomycetes bacterium]|nr:hypothetical protein [Planctomycetota bacterium]
MRAAEERLFDAELAEVLGVSVEAVAEPGAGRGSPRRLWLAAAVALFGLAITFAVAFASAAADRVEAQDPESLEPPQPLPILFWQSGSAPPAVATQSLMFQLGDGDLSPLSRYERLQNLRVFAVKPGRACRAGFFAPLVPLAQLEVLRVVVPAAMGTEVLRELRGLEHLRFLSLDLQRPLTVADVAALGEIHGLVSLGLEAQNLGAGDLGAVAVDAAAMRALSDLSHLQALRLERLPGCTAATLRELRGAHGLRRLILVGFGTQPVATEFGWQPAEDSAGFTADIARALAELPLLEDVWLEACAVTPAALQALPVGLRAFGLTGCPDADAEVVRAIARFGELELLRLDRAQDLNDQLGRPRAADAEPPRDLPDQRAVARAQAELVRDLPIRELRSDYGLHEEVAAALADAGQLAVVELIRSGATDVSAVAAVPALTRLTLNQCRVHADDLAPLRPAKALRELRMVYCNADRAAVTSLLPGVAVTFDL